MKSTIALALVLGATICPVHAGDADDGKPASAKLVKDGGHKLSYRLP